MVGQDGSLSSSGSDVATVAPGNMSEGERSPETACRSCKSKASRCHSVSWGSSCGASAAAAAAAADPHRELGEDDGDLAFSRTVFALAYGPPISGPSCRTDPGSSSSRESEVLHDTLARFIKGEEALPSCADASCVQERVDDSSFCSSGSSVDPSGGSAGVGALKALKLPTMSVHKTSSQWDRAPRDSDIVTYSEAGLRKQKHGDGLFSELRTGWESQMCSMQ